MLTRNTRRTVTFARPFILNGLDGPQPPGRYVVEMEEDLIESLSFPAYRRTSTVILMPGAPGGPVVMQALEVDPDDLEAAERRDAAP